MIAFRMCRQVMHDNHLGLRLNRVNILWLYNQNLQLLIMDIASFSLCLSDLFSTCQNLLCGKSRWKKSRKSRKVVGKSVIRGLNMMISGAIKYLNIRCFS